MRVVNCIVGGALQLFRDTGLAELFLVGSWLTSPEEDRILVEFGSTVTVDMWLATHNGGAEVPIRFHRSSVVSIPESYTKDALYIVSPEHAPVLAGRFGNVVIPASPVLTHFGTIGYMELVHV